MIARADGLPHGGHAFRDKAPPAAPPTSPARSESAACSRSRAFAAANFERRAISLLARISAPIWRKRIHHAPHGPAPQRVISRDRRSERLPRQHARNHAHRRTGILGVQRLARRFQSIQSLARDASRATSFASISIPKLPQAFQRAGAVRRRRVVRNLAVSLRPARQNRVTMRNRFVPRKFDHSRRSALRAKSSFCPWRDSNTPRFASRICGRYHRHLMPAALRRLLPPFLAALILVFALGTNADDAPADFSHQCSRG